MEAIFGMILQSNNVIAIIVFIVGYLVIWFQRKNTGERRDATEKLLKNSIAAVENKAQEKLEEAIEQIQGRINTLETEKLLMAKDIEILKNDTAGIKDDVKEIKTTLNNIAISMATLAANSENKKDNKVK